MILKLLLFLLITKLSARLEVNINTSNEDITESFKDVLTEIFQKKRSLVMLIDNKFANPDILRLITQQPTYNIAVCPNLTGAIEFNGKYDITGIFDDFVTFEESKLYIYQVNDDNLFYHAVATMKRLYFYRLRDKLVVILTKDNDYQILRQVVWDLSLYNVIFLYTNGSCFTYDFIRDKKWFEIQDGRFFYNKATDYMRKTIRISMFTHVRDAIPKVYHKYFKGRDGLLARTFMNWINATGLYIPPTDGITYGENRGNRNITGVFGDVARNITDIALNSRLMKPEFENVVEYSYPHDRDDLIVLVPCGNSDPAIEYNKSFTGIVWLIVLVFNGLCLVVFIKTNTFDQASTAALYAFGIFFGQSYSSSKTTVGRVLVLLYTFYAFLILVHYSSLLMSIITVPHKPQEIDTIEELAASQLKMYTVERYKRYLMQFGEASVKQLKDRIFIATEKEIVDLVDTHGSYAVICKRSVADWAVLNRRNFRDGKMVHRIMKKSPFPAIVCYIVKYGSSLKGTLNKFMKTVIESGIQNHWMEMTLYEITCEESRFVRVESYPMRRIFMGELVPIFIIYGVGNVVAALVFVGEVIYQSIERKHNPKVKYKK